MRSGKTDELIRRLTVSQYGGLKVVAFRPSHGCKDAEHPKITSRNGQTFPAVLIRQRMLKHPKRQEDEDLYRKETLDTVLENIDDAHVVGIDEAQFVPFLPEICELLVRRKKIVHISFLNGDYEQKLFASVGHILPKLDHLVVMTAVCSNCPYGFATEAPFTIPSTVEIWKALKGLGGELVGDEQFRSVCRACLRDWNNFIECHIDIDVLKKEWGLDKA